MKTAIPKSITVRGGANNTSTVKQSRCDHYPNVGIMAAKLDWSVITKHRHFAVSVDYGKDLGNLYIVLGTLTDAETYDVKTVAKDNVETARSVPASKVIETIKLYVASLCRRRKLDVPNEPGPWKTHTTIVPVMIITPEII